jgi:hypothetical protein
MRACCERRTGPSTQLRVISSIEKYDGETLLNFLRSRVVELFAPLAIIVLPLLGFYVDRRFDELVTGPAIYTLYVLGVIAYAAAISGQLPPSLSSMASGVLGTGAVIAAVIGVLGSLVAFFIVIVSLGPLGPPKSAYDWWSQFGIDLVLIAIVLSPWATALVSGKVAASTLRFCAARSGKALTTTWAIVGVGLTIIAMSWAEKADADWLAPRLKTFETDDTARWEQSLKEIQANWLCGHRRCLMPICYKLMDRLGRTSGESGPFASPFGFAIEAPNAPSHLAEPFIKVYGYPVRQVCAIGD